MANPAGPPATGPGGRRRRAGRRRPVVAVLLDGDEAADIGQLGRRAGGLDVYGGCVFAVSTAGDFTQWCPGGDGGWKEIQSPRSTAPGRAAPVPRQRLGVDQRHRHRRGVGDELAAAPDRVEDWGNILPAHRRPQRRHRPAAARSSPRSTRTTRTPRSQLTRSTRRLEQAADRPRPRRRADRPIDVDVLANDTDPTATSSS